MATRKAMVGARKKVTRPKATRKKATRKKAVRKKRSWVGTRAGKAKRKGDHPEVGDVISCRKFANASCHNEIVESSTRYLGLRGAKEKIFQNDRKRLRVGAGGPMTGFRSITGIDPDGDRVTVDKGEMHTSTNCPDKSRGFAKFVVERTSFDGGGTAQVNDVYPDGHHAWARRLNEDGSYDDEGEVMEFYTSGCFNCQAKPEDIRYHVKKMRAVMVPA